MKQNITTNVQSELFAMPDAKPVLGDVFNNTVKFKTLKIGQEFECYGDVTIKYNYPKMCRCIKDSEDSAHEIDGINFYINSNDSVFVNIT